MPTIEGITFSNFRVGQILLYKGTQAKVVAIRGSDIQILLKGDTHQRTLPPENFKSLKLYWKQSSWDTLYMKYDLHIPIQTFQKGKISISVLPVRYSSGHSWRYSYDLTNIIKGGTFVAVARGEDPQKRVFSSIEEAKEQALKTVNRIFRLENL